MYYTYTQDEGAQEAKAGLNGQVDAGLEAVLPALQQVPNEAVNTFERAIEEGARGSNGM